MAILISEGKYHPSYITRQKLFKELTNNKELVDLVDEQHFEMSNCFFKCPRL